MEVRKLNKEQIEAYKKKQIEDILELRKVMGEILSGVKAERVLCVGEGVSWKTTFTSSVIDNNFLPKNIKLIVLLDLYFKKNSIFYLAELWENKDYIILPVIGDATNLQFPSNYFDAVCAPLMIDDCLDHQSLIKELFRCTKKGGIIMISGHGIDLVGELSKIPELIGARHRNPISPSTLDEYVASAHSLEVKDIKKWRNNHTWLRVYQKI